jgi:hypothetical protein
MEIKPVSGNINLVKNNIVKKQEEQKQESSPKDRLEISSEAKTLSSASIKGKNLDEIRSRIASDYYNSDEVISKVADRILKELSE